MGAGGNQRPRHTEVGEQQLPEIRNCTLFFPFKSRQLHIFQSQSTIWRQSPSSLTRAPATGRYDPVAQGRRHAVSVAGGAGAGITGRRRWPKSPPPPDMFPFLQQRTDQPRRFHGPGPVPDPSHPQPLTPAAQGPGYVEGAVRLGKDPVSPLGFQGHPQRLKKRHGIPAVEPGKGPVQKTSVPGMFTQQLSREQLLSRCTGPCR